MSDCKIFAKTLEDSAAQQIQTLLEQEAFVDSRVRIMPDVHAGAGCVIGFTADLGDKVIPNLVGVDIGCGMRVIKIDKRKDEIDLQKVDEVIRECIPSGFNLRSHEFYPGLGSSWYGNMRCFPHINQHARRYDLSIGTLGGGNHFIELDEDENENVYLVIHTGSRNLGVQVAKYYQNLAIETKCGTKEVCEQAVERTINHFKALNQPENIAPALARIKELYQMLQVPNDLAFLMGKGRDDYLHDMKLCQQYARSNRSVISSIILDEMGWNFVKGFETIHNYIDDNNMIRKGAVSAHKGELLLIPMNMRDGSLLCVGKGNPDWNESAPHGAGRLMSRSQAKKKLDMKQYQKEMDGIYTTSVCAETIDEAPMAYKPMQEIVDLIGDTVEIVDILKPIYNFKAAEA